MVDSKQDAQRPNDQRPQAGNERNNGGQRHKRSRRRSNGQGRKDESRDTGAPRKADARPQAKGAREGNQGRPNPNKPGRREHRKTEQHKGEHHNKNDRGGRRNDNAEQTAPLSPLHNLPTSFAKDPPLQLNSGAKQKASVSSEDAKRPPQRYGVAFYETFQAAKTDATQLVQLISQFDQLNIVIRAEGNMDDPELTSLGSVKVFAGAAWTLIHERRKQEGWYDEPR